MSVESVSAVSSVPHGSVVFSPLSYANQGVLSHTLSFDSAESFEFVSEGMTSADSLVALLVERMSSFQGFFWVAYVDGEVAGFFGVYDREYDSVPGWYVKTWVAPAFRGRGLNTVFIQRLAVYARLSNMELRAVVRGSNKSSYSSFVKALGDVPVAELVSNGHPVSRFDVFHGAGVMSLAFDDIIMYDALSFVSDSRMFLAYRVSLRGE